MSEEHDLSDIDPEVLAEDAREHSAVMAKLLVSAAIRNGRFLEDFHAGEMPNTQTGDYSDVYVIDGSGRRIAWNNLSRISDDEMRVFIKDAVNSAFTVLLCTHINNPEEYLPYLALYMAWAEKWDDPEVEEKLTFDYLKNQKNAKPKP